MDYEILKELANGKLDIALKFNRLKYYLAGAPLYEVTTRDCAGREVQATGVIMSNIYERHKNDPQLMLDKKVYDTLLQMEGNSKHPLFLAGGLKCIGCHLDAEKNGYATFHMDCEKLLEALRQNLTENKDLFLSKRYKEVPGIAEALDDLKEQIRIFQEQFGIKIM